MDSECGRTWVKEVDEIGEKGRNEAAGPRADSDLRKYRIGPPPLHQLPFSPFIQPQIFYEIDYTARFNPSFL